MKKTTIFMFLMVFLCFGLSADNIFKGIKFKTIIGAESLSIPTKADNFDVFRYDMFVTIGEDEFSYKQIYTLSIKDPYLIETQNRIFAKLQMEGEHCGVYLKIGKLQHAEKMLGNFKIRWQDEYVYDWFNKEYHDLFYNEYFGNEATSQPTNNYFYGFGTDIYIINSKKIGFNLNGEFSTFHDKRFELNFMHNLEVNQEFEIDAYVDGFDVSFYEIENKMLKVGGQFSVKGEKVAPWINVSYIFYRTELWGKYTSQYFDYGFNGGDKKYFYTETDVINHLLLSSGIIMKIAKNFEVEVYASLGSFNSAGLLWRFLP